MQGEILRHLDAASLKCFAAISKNYHSDFNNEDVVGEVFLEEAVAAGHVELVEWALDLGCPFDADVVRAAFKSPRIFEMAEVFISLYAKFWQDLSTPVKETIAELAGRAGPDDCLLGLNPANRSTAGETLFLYLYKMLNGALAAGPDRATKFFQLAFEGDRYLSSDVSVAHRVVHYDRLDLLRKYFNWPNSPIVNLDYGSVPRLGSQVVRSAVAALLARGEFKRGISGRWRNLLTSLAANGNLEGFQFIEEALLTHDTLTRESFLNIMGLCSFRASNEGHWSVVEYVLEKYATEILPLLEFESPVVNPSYHPGIDYFDSFRLLNEHFPDHIRRLRREEYWLAMLMNALSPAVFELLERENIFSIPDSKKEAVSQIYYIFCRDFRFGKENADAALRMHEYFLRKLNLNESDILDELVHRRFCEAINALIRGSRISVLELLFKVVDPAVVKLCTNPLTTVQFLRMFKSTELNTAFLPRYYRKKTLHFVAEFMLRNFGDNLKVFTSTWRSLVAGLPARTHQLMLSIDEDLFFKV